MTGPGGIGKTVLAQAVARNLLATCGGDGLLVELASQSDPALVPFAVATVLGVRQGGDQISFDSIAREIAARKLLLVLDNCEHLIGGAARLAQTLVQSCPNVTILATSREVLRIEGEYVYRVPPLDVPGQSGDKDHDILGRSAVQLLIARTKALNADFSPHGENLALVAAISRQLDGIPLAIEFAAARIATLGLQQVAARLHDRFNLLTRGLRTALPRHQTLLATLDWSYELLSETEARVLRHLAVFNGDFSLNAATAVMGNLDAVSVADSLTDLVVKSLVAADFQTWTITIVCWTRPAPTLSKSCAVRESTGKPRVAMRNTSGKPSFRPRPRAIPCRPSFGSDATADILAMSAPASNGHSRRTATCGLAWR